MRENKERKRTQVLNEYERTGKPNGTAAEPASEKEVLAARAARHDVLLEDNVAIHRGGGVGALAARSLGKRRVVRPVRVVLVQVTAR